MHLANRRSYQQVHPHPAADRGVFAVTPIKLEKFMLDTKPAIVQELTIDLNELGLFHCAPKEGGRPILAMRYDAATSTLVPVN